MKIAHYSKKLICALWGHYWGDPVTIRSLRSWRDLKKWLDDDMPPTSYQVCTACGTKQFL